MARLHSRNCSKKDFTPLTLTRSPRLSNYSSLNIKKVYVHPDTTRMDWLEEGLRMKRPRFHIPEGKTFRAAIDEEIAREKCPAVKCKK